MWLLTWPWPNGARIRLPPERKLFPWHYRSADTARAAELLTGIIEGVERHVILPWPAVEALARRPEPERWEHVLLVAVAQRSGVQTEKLDDVLSGTGAPHVVAQLPEPAEDGYGWQERVVKPALLRRLQMDLAVPDHPLATFGVQAMPLRKVAALAMDALDFLDLAEAALAHRLERTGEGTSERDYLRSVWWAAGRMAAERLLRLPPDIVLPALSVLLAVNAYKHSDKRLRSAAEGLQAVGLARVVGADVSLRPLARAAAEQPEVLAALRERIPALPGSSRTAPVEAGEREAIRAGTEGKGAKGEDFAVAGLTMDHLPKIVVRVEQVLELQGRTTERLTAPTPFRAHLRVRGSDGFNVEPWAAVSGDVDMTLLQAFQREIDAPYRVLNPVLVSTLVHEGQVLSKEVYERARAEHVRLLRFEELQRSLMDLEPYLHGQTRRLQSDLVYPPKYYVDQRLVLLVGDQQREHPHALEALSEELSSEQGRFILVLGDFGTGKTFLLHELARRMALSGGSVAPILINLRDLEKTHSLNGLLGQHFGAARVPFDALVFRYLMREGRVALLFDGFDELALRVRYDRAAMHLETLLQATEGQAKVVVTSRTQHFLSDTQVKSALYDRVDRAARRTIARLLPFDRQQKARFLERRLGDEAGASRLALIEQIKDLAGLSENARMLSFIAVLPEQDLLRARDRQGQISAASLYRRLIDKWFEGEERRVGANKGALPGLTTEERWRAVEHLALELWGRANPTVGVADLPAHVAVALRNLSAQDLDHDTAAHQVGSATLLVRDAEGQLSFLHQSVLEWLVANAAAKALSKTEAPAMLHSGAMSDLMADFFIDLAAEGAAVAWAQAVTQGEAQDAAKRNALVVLKRAGVELLTPADYRGKDLGGQDFSGRDLTNADFSAANLTEARLVGTRLVGAILRGATLVDADLERADLRNADLTDANLVGARLSGADLDMAILTGAVLDRAKLVGATGVEVTLARAKSVTGACLPKHPPPEIGYAESSAACYSIATWGNIVASGHYDGILRIWDCMNGTLLRSAEAHSRAIESVAISLDGGFVASSTSDGSIRIWDHSLRKLQHTLQHGSGRILSIAFSPRGDTLASASADGTLRLWDTSSGVPLTLMTGHTGKVRSVAFRPDGAVLASGSEDCSVNLWQLTQGLVRRSLSGHSSWVTCVAFSPDGEILASGSEDNSVRLWDPESGALLHCLQGHSHWVTSVAFSSDGRLVASGSRDRSVRLWDPSSGRLLRSLDGPLPVMATTLHPSGKYVVTACAGGSLHLWRVSDGARLAVLLGGRDGWVTFRPDGRYKFHGDIRNHFWHRIESCRFEPGELDPYIPGLRMPDDEPLDPSP